MREENIIYNKENRRENIITYYTKYLILIIFSCSFLTALLSILCNDMMKYSGTGVRILDVKASIPQCILFAINTICVFSFIVVNTKSMDKKLFRNHIISNIIYFILIFNIIVSIDFYFLKWGLMLLNLINILNIFNILFYPLTNIFFGLSEIYKRYYELPEIVFYIILMFFQILANNIIFTLFFRIVKYKDNNKYITSTLYYIQNNSLWMMLMSVMYLGQIA
jgi:hypothetical protein